MPNTAAPVRAACRRPHAAGILPGVTPDPIDLETLRAGARLAGFNWSDAELEEVRPQVEAALRVLRVLDSADLSSAEPTTHYRSV